MKKLLIFSALPLFLVMIIIFAAAGGGSGGAGAAAVGAVATEEKAEDYGLKCAELGIPWEIVMITDSVIAERKGAAGIEDINPMETAIQFIIVLESKDEYEQTGEETHIDDYGIEYTVPVYGWVYKSQQKYIGAAALLKYIGVTEIGDLTPTQLVEKVQAAAADKSDSEARYTAILYTNTDYQSVLEAYTDLKPKEIETILEMNEIGYMSKYVSPEVLARIRETQALFGMYQYSEYDGTGVDLGDVVFTDGAIDVVYYNQRDERWKDTPYGTSTIGVAGCGTTSMAIVISTLTGTAVDPVTVTNWSVEQGYWIHNVGSSHALIPGAAQAWGLPVEGCGKDKPQKIVNALASGKLVVVIVAPGTFTTVGHFMVLRGVTSDGQILLADPVSVSNSEKTWPLEIFIKEARSGAGAGGPFWIIG